MTSLAEIRAKLAQQENNSGGGNSGPSGPNPIYPFWNMQEGQSATLRFLPDGDSSNTFFWKERLMIKLPFQGKKGETDSKPITVQVPCMEMYGESCPILGEVRGWFKDPSLEDMGRKYWKKRSYIFQGFVNDNPIADDESPENPIRRFIIGPQIFQIIKQALMDPDMEELPTDFTQGIDFRLNKTKKGEYADYSTSTWARRERPLSDVEMQAVNTHGLWNLNDFLPAKPDETSVRVLTEMFEASVDGEAYDAERWGAYFKAPGAPTGDVAKAPAPAAAPAAAPVAEAASDVPFDVDPAPAAAPAPATAPAAEAASSESPNSADILAMIRQRQQG